MEPTSAGCPLYVDLRSYKVHKNMLTREALHLCSHSHCITQTLLLKASIDTILLPHITLIFLQQRRKSFMSDTTQHDRSDKAFSRTQAHKHAEHVSHSVKDMARTFPSETDNIRVSQTTNITNL